ncbi:MAG: DUF1570 domain-containing protein [Planctomycetes bacterium]|nr:DUF1570 domain-containing protein [Planctomycetota bacterium]
MRRTQAIVACLAVCLGLPHVFCADEKKDEFFTVKTKNYRIESNVSKDYARAIGDLMEDAHKAYSSIFRKVTPKVKFPSIVRVYRTRKGYLKFYKKLAGQSGAASGGFFIRTREGGQLVSFAEGQPLSTMKETLYHEGFHQFLASRVPNAPIWLNEGLATLFQYGQRKGTTLDARVIPVGRLRFLQKAIKENKTKSLSYLMDSTQMDWHRASAVDQYLYYCESWMLVYFLAYSSKGKYRKALNKYIMLLHDGMSPLRARLGAFGGDTYPLEEAWKEFALSREPSPMYVCKENMGLIAVLVMVYQKRLNKRYTDIADFRADILAEKLKGWELPLSGGGKVKSSDLDQIRTWFHCPARHSKGDQPDYLFTRDRDPECEYPDIVCRWHKGTELHLYWYRDPADNKLKPDIIDERAGDRLGLKVAP